MNSKYLKTKPKVEFEKDKPMGDKIRVLDMSFAEKNGITAKINLEDGLDETIDWYLKNINEVSLKFNAFNNL